MEFPDKQENTSQPAEQQAAQPKPQPTQQQSLYDAGNKIMGDFLVQYFQGNIIGQTQGLNWKPSYEEPVRRIGMSLFQIHPRDSTYNRADTIQHVVRFMENIPNDTLEQVISDLVGDPYIKETDLVESLRNNTLSFNDLSHYIVELQEFKQDLLTDANMNITTYHPLVLVMSMPLELRPFMSLVIDHGISQDGRQPNSYNQKYKMNPDRIEKTFLEGSPRTKSYVAVAKQYGLKQLIPIMKAYADSMYQHKMHWRM